MRRFVQSLFVHDELWPSVKAYLVLVVVSLASLGVTYYWTGATGSDWSKVFGFDGVGIQVEVLILLLLIFFAFASTRLFKDDLRLYLTNQAGGLSDPSNRVRAVAVGVVALGAVGVTLYHLVVAPVVLSEKPSASVLSFSDHYLPYLTYLPYSFVNVIVLTPLACLAAITGVFGYHARLRDKTEQLNAKSNAVDSKIEMTSVNGYVAEWRDFKLFHKRNIINLLWFASLALTFFLVSSISGARHTFDTAAQDMIKTVMFTLALLPIVIAILVIAIPSYGRTYDVTLSRLAKWQSKVAPKVAQGINNHYLQVSKDELPAKFYLRIIGSAPSLVWLFEAVIIPIYAKYFGKGFCNSIDIFFPSFLEPLAHRIFCT